MNDATAEELILTWDIRREATDYLEVEREYLEREPETLCRDYRLQVIRAELERRTALPPYYRARAHFDLAFIQHLKERAPLEAMIRSCGVMLFRSGGHLAGCCPFHQDDSPSLHVWPDDEHWWCFGACSQGGDIIDWVMVDGIHFHGETFREAVKEVARWAGVPLPDGGRLPPAGQRTVTIPAL